MGADLLLAISNVSLAIVLSCTADGPDYNDA